jgi:hypothetical protein
MDDSDISRRSAIVTIGQAAVGIGLSGTLRAETDGHPQLPAGLYQASNDHLTHALMSSGRFHPIPPGCPTDYIHPKSEPFTPLFFSSSEFTIVRRVAQLMLGDALSMRLSGTPAFAEEIAEWIDLRVASAAAVREAAHRLNPLHRALAVAYFGSGQLSRVETGNPERICSEGFEWLLNTAQARGRDQFLSLNEEEQLATLESISDRRQDKTSENAGTRFFTLLKTEVIRGFYTSQVGLKELDFKGNAFYARSPGCNMKT